MAKTVTTHLCVDIRGVLLNWKDDDIAGMFKNDDGTPMSAREVKITLMDELLKGHKVLPIGDKCDNFSYEDGCQGHEVDDLPDNAPEKDINVLPD